MEKQGFVKIQYLWQNNADDLLAAKTGEQLVSKTFCVSYNSRSLSFQIGVYPNGEISCNSGVGLFFKYTDGFLDKINDSKISFAFLHDTTSSPLCSGSTAFEKGKCSGIFLDTNVSFFFRYFLTRLGRQKCTIKCTIDVPLDYFTSGPVTLEVGIEGHIGGKLLDCVLNNKNRNLFTDVTLNSSDGKSFHCHKAVLGIQSNFFQKLFSSDMTESKNDEINLELSTEALVELLRYLYTEKVVYSNVKRVAKELLHASEMCELDSLKRHCEICLFDDVNIDNAISVLQIANLFSLNDLKNKAICIIVENFEMFAKSHAWLKLMEKEPLLGSEVILNAATRLNVQIDIIYA